MRGTFWRSALTSSSLSKIPMRKIPADHGRAADLAVFRRAPALGAGAAASWTRRSMSRARVIRINTAAAGRVCLFQRQEHGRLQGRGLSGGRGPVSTGWRSTRAIAGRRTAAIPTNTPGWWGGAHPFALLDYSVVHNGEISSYDANRRCMEMFGYQLHASDRYGGHHLYRSTTCCGGRG